MKSPGELYNDALNAHFGTQHPSNQWDRLSLERRARFELAAQTFLKAVSYEPSKPASGPVGELEEHKALSPLVGQGSSVARVDMTPPSGASDSQEGH